MKLKYSEIKGIYYSLTNELELIGYGTPSKIDIKDFLTFLELSEAIDKELNVVAFDLDELVQEFLELDPAYQVEERLEPYEATGETDWYKYNGIRKGDFI